MRTQPSQQLLDIWRAAAEASFRDGQWTWGGGRAGRNAVSDAEQLLCLLLPATTLRGFVLDRPDETADGTLDALQILGDAVEIPRLLAEVVNGYLERYTDADGTPIFSGGGYFESEEPGVAPTAAQRSLDVVSSFATSVTLSLAAIGFVQVFRSAVRREDLRQRLSRIEDLASLRLSAAMVGLLRSFTVSVFDIDSPEGVALCRLINAQELTDRQLFLRLRRNLRETMASLRELRIGSGEVVGLDSPDRFFECGWSWGIVEDAPEVKTDEEIGTQRPGTAEVAPYMHFTVAAMNAIDGLFGERTRVLGLLNDEQQRLARALQLRWELTRRYWTTIATFGTGTWPLEDLPWQATDSTESDYYSLLVTSLTIRGFRAAGSEPRWSRLAAVLIELAGRGRITRRPLADDPALQFHSPGVRIYLNGAEHASGPRLYWTLNDFPPLLLECSAQVAAALTDIVERQRLLELIDQIWGHLARRRLDTGPGRGLWDQPGGAFVRVRERYELPSWLYTQRVVEALVVTVDTLTSAPSRSTRLSGFAVDLLSEADRLFDQELMRYATTPAPELLHVLDALQAKLNLARQIIDDRPGSAAALAVDVLRDLTQIPDPGRH
jgi:hypothetical protein